MFLLNWFLHVPSHFEGETNPKIGYIVGGKHPEQSFIVAENGLKLERDGLANVHVCTLLKAVDRRGGGYIIQQIPRDRQTKAPEELIEFGKVVSACCQANADQPPVSVAMDCHGSFDLIHQFYLGLLSPSQYCEIPFMKDCRPQPRGREVQIPCFPFQGMLYKDTYPVFGCADAKHVLKAVSRALRASCRIVKVFLAIL